MIAIIAGAGLGALAYSAMTLPPNTMAGELLARALPEAYGQNVVNVILVDFRAFDTLGEITVLGIVGLTVYALLRRFRPAAETIDIPEQQIFSAKVVAKERMAGSDTITADDYLAVPSTLVRLLLPIACVYAFHLFLRGHNEPGGGFVAGLVISIALIAQYMISGTRWVETQTDLRPTRWIGVGLFLALFTGLGSLVLDYPFMTSHTAHVSLPVIGEIHLPSGSVFDLGVFAVVVGSTLSILMALAHQSLRARRQTVVVPATEGGV